MNSTNDVFAEPMIVSQKYLEKYMKQVTELGEKGLLPNLDETLKYKVYSIRGSQFGAHKSIVLSTDDKHFITVELGFDRDTPDGKTHIRPVTQELNKPDDLEYLGTIEAKGMDLLAKALDVMTDFGRYFKLSNNCQDFCNKYLEEIGLKKAKSFTDGDKFAIGAMLVAGVIALLAIALKKMWQNTK